MSLSEPVAVVIGALVTGVLTGGPALIIGRRRRTTPPVDRVEAALNARVNALDERLSAQYESRITYLEAQCENKDRTIAELQKQARRRSSND